MKLYLIILTFHLFFCIIEIDGNIEYNLFHVTPNSGKPVNSPHYRTIIKINRLRCAKFCSLEKNCLSFFYQQNFCFLFNTSEIKNFSMSAGLGSFGVVSIYEFPLI